MAFLNEFMARVRKIKPGIWLVMILLFAIFLRFYFFTGYISADPQDEGIYLNNVLRILDGKFNFERFKSLEIQQAETINPATTKQFALALILPVAFISMILGVSEFNLVLWSLLCSLASIIVIYLLGKELFNEKTGLIASLLLSFYPLNVFYATRIQIEMPVLLFTSLSVLLFIRALNGKRSKTGYFLAGASFALAYLTKTRASLFALFFLTYLLYLTIRDRKINKQWLLIPAGFLLIFSIAGAYYYLESGDFFLAEHMRLKANEHQFKKAPGIRDFYLTKEIHVFNSISRPIYYSELIFDLAKHRRVIKYFGYFYFALVASILWFILSRVVQRFILHRAPSKKTLNSFCLLLFWLVPLFLYMEFGFLRINLAYEPNLVLNYCMMIKNPRYLVLITSPVILLISALLAEIDRNILGRLLSFVVILLLLATSLQFISINHNHFTEGVRDIRIASEFFRENPKPEVYVDHLSLGRLRIFDYSNKDRYKNFNSIRDPERLSNAYLIIGGSRSTDLLSSYVYSLEPEFMEDPPSSWQIVKTIYGEINPHRNKYMDIYYAP